MHIHWDVSEALVCESSWQIFETYQKKSCAENTVGVVSDTSYLNVNPNLLTF